MHMALSGTCVAVTAVELLPYHRYPATLLDAYLRIIQRRLLCSVALTACYSAATNTQTGEGVAIKKVTNVFSKKILAKRALREIKLLQHFRGHRNVRASSRPSNEGYILSMDLTSLSL